MTSTGTSHCFTVSPLKTSYFCVVFLAVGGGLFVSGWFVCLGFLFVSGNEIFQF